MKTSMLKPIFSFIALIAILCLVGTAGGMSLMFPTIYGMALKRVGEDAKLGAAGLIMAILGGSVMPPAQGAIIDLQSVSLGAFSFSAVRVSFVLPLVCFVVIALFGWRISKERGNLDIAQ